MMTFLKALVSPLTSLASMYMENKRQEKQELHEQKIQIIRNTANWEEIQAQNSATSWKDELWTLVLASPVVAIMVAVSTGDTTIIDRVNQGFATLGTLPEWYQYLMFIAVTASFGIKGADKVINMIGSRK